MSKKEHSSAVWGGGLARGVPAPLDLAGERLLPKLVVVVVLGLGLAVASELADDGLRQARLQGLETPATATPPAAPYDERLRPDSTLLARHPRP